MSGQKLWATTKEAAEILRVKNEDGVYTKIDNGTIPKSEIFPRVKGGPILIRRAFLEQIANGTQSTSNLLPFGRTIDMDELADKLLARMIANPALAKAVADVAMRPLFDQLMGKAS